MAVSARMSKILQRTKDNLILQHREDDTLLLGFIAATVAYAEEYQHKPEGYYTKRENRILETTEQTVVMLASHFYESRDGSTSGFFADSVHVSANAWTVVNNLLRLNRDVVF